VDYDYAVIGAGVVGLAVAAELASRGSTIVLEKHTKFGQGTSSRNSEVIHAGLYYATGSLKARLCIEGRTIIEELAARGKFGYAPIGKYIVAVDERERQLLSELKANAESCGVSDLRWADLDEFRGKEPEVRAVAALFSPHTGIVDSHGMMDYFRRTAADRGADFAWGAEVKKIETRMAGAGYDVSVANGEELSARCIINSAGLHADTVAEMVGMDVRALGLDLKWSRGVYYGIEGEAGLRVEHLIYPVPDKSRATLGVHVCVDLAGGIRFGPTAEPMSAKVEDYAPPHSHIESVAQGLSRYLPKVRAEFLYPVMVGIRPKLSAPGEPVRDFYIREEGDRGLLGFVNLIGIESPGLTAAPAIARLVNSLLV
jgi:L-2-hydroxyglutarate oxidase LhgO